MVNLEVQLDYIQNAINNILPTNGTDGQFLKAENTELTKTVWADVVSGGDGGGAVDSVNGNTGDVVLNTDDIAQGVTNLYFSAAEQSKLSGITSSATANSADDVLLGRANHTGVQAISTIDGLQTVLDGKASSGDVFSGNYDDLTNKPVIPTAFSGDYDDLTNKPDQVSALEITAGVSVDVRRFSVADIVSITTVHGGGVGGGANAMIPLTGRFYLYTDNRWVTDSDDNYGPSYYQFNESGAVGVTPVMEWEHMGIFVPAGRTIEKFHFTGKTNNSQVTDLEFYCVLRYPDPITRWESGMDNDGEDDHVLLLNSLFMAPVGETAFTGGTNDSHRRTWTIGQSVDQDSYLSVYIRPVGVLTATRYMRASYMWEIS